MSGLLLVLGGAGVVWMFVLGVFGHDWSLAGLVMPLSTFALFASNELRRGEARRKQQAAALARERSRREAAEWETPARPPARPGGDGPDAGAA
ncbi:hypothetical protein HUT16_25680 [Kitasatospora sp. NA04385]|uniref:hypothetical protein n=1 Tax=Kitasatospora sp. NA04385 TaxID=2742135 RepID=UPI0015913CA6|nr:hypothetical protein [Kitasatospora sp. NA04385]QKW21997.1 hypothetical protein HUT16_25680 [Kitasatospora sp. NA04385]